MANLPDDLKKTDQTYTVTLILTIKKEPYCLEDFYNMVKSFNDIHEGEIHIETVKTMRKK